MITQKQAFQDVIDKWVLGDHPFSWGTYKDPMKEANGFSEKDAETVGCIYRRADAGGCAIGQYIPEDKYRPEMEGSVATVVVADFPDIFEGVNPSHDGLIDDQTVPLFWGALQGVHDALATMVNHRAHNLEGNSAEDDQYVILAPARFESNLLECSKLVGDVIR